MLNMLIYSKRERSNKVTDINTMDRGLSNILRGIKAGIHNVHYGTP